MNAMLLYARWNAADVERIVLRKNIDDAQCRKDLAADVLRIAKVMTTKSVRPGKFYDLDEIWDDLTPWAS